MPQERARYVIQYTPNRASLLETMTENEGKAIGAHFQYLTGLLKSGSLIFAGRRVDAAFGLAVFEEYSDEAARAVANADPAVQAGVFSATVGRFEFALAADQKLL